MSAESNEKENDRKRIVVVKKEDEEEKHDRIPPTEINLAPLGGPSQEEPTRPIVVATKTSENELEPTNVVIAKPASNLAPLGGPIEENAETNKILLNEELTKKVAEDKELTEELTNKTATLSDKREKEGEKEMPEKKDGSEKKTEKEVYPGSMSTKSCAKCTKNEKECKCNETEGSFNKERMSDSNKASDKSIDKASEHGVKKEGPTNKSTTEGLSNESKPIESKRMEYKPKESKPMESKPIESKPKESKPIIGGIANKSATSTNSFSNKSIPDTNKTASTGSTSSKLSQQVKIDESKNQSYKVGGMAAVGGFTPTKLDNPEKESILHELRRKNSIVAEGGIFKKRAFFFCFWVQKYFVLLNTGEFLWLEMDGSGSGSGNWNIKKATAFNKLEYEGYSHPYRLTYSIESDTGYLAFDTEVERNYWHDLLQDTSRS